MKFSTRLVERYVAGAILPYLLLSLLLLTAVLVAQQGSRFAELLGQVQAPLSFVFEIILNIIPGLLLFTIPMSVLTGTLIGFSRLGSDSELTALRAGGIGTLRILSAPLLIGVAGTILTLYIGIIYTPVAAARLRDAAMRAAVERLKSPIQPGTFATNVGDKVIYVREGDAVTGEWRGVFVYSQEGEGRALVVTAEGGRLDTSQDVAELVLRDATAMTINLPETSRDEGKRLTPQTAAGGTASRTQSITERSAQSRIKLDDQLGVLVERLRTRQPELDESEWDQLRATAQTARTHQQRLSARIILHKKLALGFAPLCFALLGAVIGLRVKRGGRGAGALLSLVLMIIYYLAALAGEQLARTGVLPVSVGVWAATALTFLIACGLLVSSRVRISPWILRARPFASEDHRFSSREDKNHNPSSTRPALQLSTLLIGLLDRTLFGSLLLNFMFALLALTIVFMIFTVFELWRYIAANDVAWQIVAQYMLFLIPFIFASLTSVAVLVAVLLTYAVLSRRSEVVAWLACGQSVYRMAIPNFILALAIGGISWVCQDTVLPYANERQDDLRAKIRGAKTPTLAVGGRHWVLSPDGNYILSFDSDRTAANNGVLTSPLIFRTTGDGKVDRITVARRGEFIGRQPDQTEGSETESQIILSDASVLIADESGVYSEKRGREVSFSFSFDDPQVFAGEARKLAHLDSDELRLRIKQMETRGDHLDAAKARLSLAQRSVEAFTPFVMSIIAMPLAIAFGRRSALVSLCAAVLVGIMFWGVTGLFELLGTYGLLHAGIAAWGSTLIFGVLGIYLISRTKT